MKGQGNGWIRREPGACIHTIGCRLVKVRGERIFLDELDPRARGGKIKSYDCGIFCDL